MDNSQGCDQQKNDRGLEQQFTHENKSISLAGFQQQVAERGWNLRKESGRAVTCVGYVGNHELWITFSIHV